MEGKYGFERTPSLSPSKLPQLSKDTDYQRRRDYLLDTSECQLRPSILAPQILGKNKNAGILALEGFLNYKGVCAIPDTGAQANFIQLSFANSIGIIVRNNYDKLESSFRMANGKRVPIIGQISARWRFKQEIWKSYGLRFYLLADCIFDVIIGDRFLRSTQIMSVNKHRLSRIPRPISALSVKYTSLLGCPSQRIRGKLNEEQISALPDYGAETNLISYDYAKRRGWTPCNSSDDSSLLQYPDGSVSTTEGQVRAVWRFTDHLEYETKKVVTFDVLHDLPYDIIFGQEFLEDTNAFSRHETCFHEVSSENECVDFNLVIWCPGNSKRHRASQKTASPSTTSPPLEKEAEDELERRALNNREIRKTEDLISRQAAEHDEKKRKEKWESVHPGIWISRSAPSPNLPSHPQFFSNTRLPPSTL